MENKYLEKILEEVKKKRNLNFSRYRRKLLERRVMVRVRMVKRTTFEEYYAYLKFHPGEMDNLMDALTINVTEFFRDTEVFDAIEKKVIPDLFRKKDEINFNKVRIWSCASSSGEEAYSVLMLIAEHLGSRLARYDLKIFGTDIDPQALAKAREAVYEARQFRNIPEDKKRIVEKYFYDMENRRYWIREEWPAYMDFSYHDVTADVPLEHMDIIFCRNLFIYFDRDLQQQVLNRFWSSLNRGGVFNTWKCRDALGGGQREVYRI